MANYCYNSLEIEGREEDIKKLEEFITIKAKDGSTELDFDKIIPVKNDEVRSDKWGTKWVAEVNFENHGDSAECYFDSAWSPSLPITLEMSKMFNLKINHYYEESGCDFEGDFEVENGEVLNDEQRNYRPMCNVCGVKFDREEMVEDEDGYEDKCLSCADELVKLVKEKLGSN